MKDSCNSYLMQMSCLVPNINLNCVRELGKHFLHQAVVLNSGFMMVNNSHVVKGFNVYVEFKEYYNKRV